MANRDTEDRSEDDLLDGMAEAEQFLDSLPKALNVSENQILSKESCETAILVSKLIWTYVLLHGDNPVCKPIYDFLMEERYNDDLKSYEICMQALEQHILSTKKEQDALDLELQNILHQVKEGNSSMKQMGDYLSKVEKAYAQAKPTKG